MARGTTDDVLKALWRKTRNADKCAAILGLPIQDVRDRLGAKTVRPPRQHSNNAAWRVIGGRRIYFRSSWEANYARYLEFLMRGAAIAAWDHEPDTFWFDGIKRGVRSYLPDFRIQENDGSIRYVEVKGWMDAKSRTKIKRMAKYHPDVRLQVVNASDYKALAAKWGHLPGWEGR